MRTSSSKSFSVTSQHSRVFQTKKKSGLKLLLRTVIGIVISTESAGNENWNPAPGGLSDGSALWASFLESGYLLWISELALDFSMRLWYENGRQLSFFGTLGLLNKTPYASKMSQPTPYAFRLCRLGRAGLFMKDAAAVSFASAAPKYLTQHVPQDLVDMVVHHLAPENYGQTPFRTLANIGDLKAVYTPWPEVSHGAFDECSKIWGRYPIYCMETCRRSSSIVWSIVRREFFVLHRGEMCKHCKLPHQSYHHNDID